MNLKVVHLALKFFLEVLRYCHVLVCPDNIVTVKCITFQDDIKTDVSLERVYSGRQQEQLTNHHCTAV